MPPKNPPGESRPRPPALMSVSQAARTLNLSCQTVRDWFHAGTLTGVRIGHQIRLFSDSVLSLLSPTPTPVKE